MYIVGISVILISERGDLGFVECWVMEGAANDDAHLAKYNADELSGIGWGAPLL